MGLRDAAKTAIERGLIASGAPARRIGAGSAQTVILSYHNVVPAGDRPVGDLSLHITQRRFAEHLDRITETHDVVALSSVVVGRRNEGRPRAVITFDDAYVGTVTAGFEELRARGLPSTVFVPPGCLGNAGFWWDRLALPGEDLPTRVREHGLGVLGGRGGEIEAWARSEGLSVSDLPGNARPADPATLFAAASASMAALGSHTWTHVNLAGVPAGEAREEITRAHAWLGEVPAEVEVVDWMAYPYGLYTDVVANVAGEVVAHALRVDGGAAEVEGGRWTAGPLELPRINVPAGLSSDGLVLRLAGLRSS